MNITVLYVAPQAHDRSGFLQVRWGCATAMDALEMHLEAAGNLTYAGYNV